MQLKSQDLAAHLRSNLRSSYLLHGSEPLLIEDSVSLLRNAATAADFQERLVFSMETGFDWSSFAAEFDSLSLFSNKKIIEFRLPGGKPGVKGAELLVKLVARQADDTMLIVLCGKLEAATKNSKWVKSFTNEAVNIEHYAISAQQLLNWIQQRARAYNLSLDTDASRLLAYYLEGNLLAMDQALKKFALLDVSRITVEDVQKSVEDSARFNIYGFVDTAISGHFKRGLRMLSGLKAEGVEPVLINWALARETRAMLQMSAEVNHGASISGVLKKYRVWSNRSRIVESSLKRVKLSQWQSVHQRLAYLDKLIKGRSTGVMNADIWTEYERIIIALC